MQTNAMLKSVLLNILAEVRGRRGFVAGEEEAEEERYRDETHHEFREALPDHPHAGALTFLLSLVRPIQRNDERRDTSQDVRDDLTMMAVCSAVSPSRAPTLRPHPSYRSFRPSRRLRLPARFRGSPPQSAAADRPARASRTSSARRRPAPAKDVGEFLVVAPGLRRRWRWRPKRRRC